MCRYFCKYINCGRKKPLLRIFFFNTDSGSRSTNKLLCCRTPTCALPWCGLDSGLAIARQFVPLSESGIWTYKCLIGRPIGGPMSQLCVAIGCWIVLRPIFLQCIVLKWHGSVHHYIIFGSSNILFVVVFKAILNSHVCWRTLWLRRSHKKEKNYAAPILNILFVWGTAKMLSAILGWKFSLQHHAKVSLISETVQWNRPWLVRQKHCW